MVIVINAFDGRGSQNSLQNTAKEEYGTIFLFALYVTAKGVLPASHY